MDDTDWTEAFAQHRLVHGAETLTRYLGRGRHFICKKSDGQSVSLVEIGTHEVITVVYEEFRREFILMFMDWEPSFILAGEDEAAKLQAAYEQEVAAFKYCMGI